MPGVVWAGTDDGNAQVSRGMTEFGLFISLDGGKKWQKFMNG